MNNFIVYDFETSGRSSRFDQILQAGIIIYDQNGKIYPFNPETFLDQFYVPQALRIMINQQFEGNVEQYLQNVSQLGTKVLFVNLNEGRVNIKYIQN